MTDQPTTQRSANPFAQFGKRERAPMGRTPAATGPMTNKVYSLRYDVRRGEAHASFNLTFQGNSGIANWFAADDTVIVKALTAYLDGKPLEVNGRYRPEQWEMVWYKDDKHKPVAQKITDLATGEVLTEADAQPQLIEVPKAADGLPATEGFPAVKSKSPFGTPLTPEQVAASTAEAARISADVERMKAQKESKTMNMPEEAAAAILNEQMAEDIGDYNQRDDETEKARINTAPLVKAAITQGTDDPTPTPSPDIVTGEIAIPTKELSELDKVFGPKAKAPGEVTTLTDDEMKETLRMKYREGLGRDMTVADFERATEWKRLEDARYADKGALTDAEIMKMIEADIAAQKKIAQEAPKPVEIEVTATYLPEAIDKPAAQGQISAEKPKPAKTLAMVPTGDSKWDVMTQQAQVMLKSGFMPASIRSAEQVLTIAMMGEALGIAPIVAINNINVIQGKPTVSPQLMLALVRRSGQLEDMKVDDDGTVCTVSMKRKGETAHVEKFSQSDAVTMGLASKDNWRKQPAVMRKWRAVSAACRIVFPDLIWGLYTTEELAPDTIVVEAA